VLWQQNFDSPQLGGPRFIQEMLKVGTLNDGQQTNYAAGLILDDYRGLATVGHSGTFMGFRTNILRFPTERVSIICLANAGHLEPDKISKQIADAILHDQLQSVTPHAVELGAGELEALKGVYRDPVTHMMLVASSESGKLAVDLGFRRYQLVPVEQNRFVTANQQVPFDVRFERSSPDNVLLAHAKVAGRERTFHRVDAVELSPTEAPSYAGTYNSDEIHLNCEIVAQGRQLVAHFANRPTVALTPTVKDQFRASDLAVEFERDGTRVRSFTLYTTQTRGVEFTRSESNSTR
jgi:hypothetical protein